MGPFLPSPLFLLSFDVRILLPAIKKGEKKAVGVYSEEGRRGRGGRFKTSEEVLLLGVGIVGKRIERSASAERIRLS